MDLFEISAECEQVQHLENFFRKRISISNSKQNFKIFGFDKYFLKRTKSLFKDFSLPNRRILQLDNQELNQSCECFCCGGKFKKKLLMCQKELKEHSTQQSRSRFPASPQQSIQPQPVRPSNRDLSLLASTTQFKTSQTNNIKKCKRIDTQNLMKKISRTHKIEQDLKQKMNEQTESLFNKVQQKILVTEEKNIDQERKNKSKKQSPSCVQYRIKTETSNYFFIHPQKKPVFNLPNLSNLDNIRKNCLSIFESKTPRILVRSEKYNQVQSLTQRLKCTYLKKSISNTSKSINNKKNLI